MDWFIDKVSRQMSSSSRFTNGPNSRLNQNKTNSIFWSVYGLAYHVAQYLQFRVKSRAQLEQTSGAEIVTNERNISGHSKHLIDRLPIRRCSRLDRGTSYFTPDFANHARTFEVSISCEDHISRHKRLEQPTDVIYARDGGHVINRQAELREDLCIGTSLHGQSRIYKRTLGQEGTRLAERIISQKLFKAQAQIYGFQVPYTTPCLTILRSRIILPQTTTTPLLSRFQSFGVQSMR